jgi:hypothetical protein
LTEGRTRKQGFWAKPEGEKKDLRNFGWVMAIGLGLIGGWAWYKGNVPAAQWLSGIAGLFLVCGLLLPVVLKPLFVVWMYLARVLGWVNTHLLLGLVFYTMFTLIGLGMRLFRHDPLDRNLEPEKESYWSRRETPLLPGDHYERQF